jgi:hypothetical protein
VGASSPWAPIEKVVSRSNNRKSNCRFFGAGNDKGCAPSSRRSQTKTANSRNASEAIRCIGVDEGADWYNGCAAWAKSSTILNDRLRGDFAISA